jgi:hypothetical protein
MKNPEHMTLDELAEEGKRLQTEMSTLAERTSRVYELMYHQARRNPDLSTPAFVSLANGGKRFAGMVNMGLKRAKSFDRVLENAKTDMAELARDQKEKQDRKEAKAAREGKAVAADPFTDLFGPDVGGRPQSPVDLMVPIVGEPTEINDVYGDEV